MRAQLVAAELADVHAVEQHATAGDVVESRAQRGERRLAGTGETDDRHRLARLDHEVDAVEQVGLVSGCVLVAVVHVLELEATDRLVDEVRVVGVCDRVDGIHHLEVPVRCRARVKGHRQQESDRVNREPQNGRGGEEGDEGSNGHLAIDRQHDAGEQSDREGHIGHDDDPQPDAADRLRLGYLRVLQLLGLHCEVRERVTTAAEGLEHANAVHRLLDGGREVAGLVLAATGYLRVARLELVAEDPQRGGAQHEDHAEHPGDGDEEEQADDDGQHIDDEQDDAEGEPAADQAEVAHHP